MVFASLMPALSPQPSTSVWHGMTAFALSTMGRSRGGGQEGEVAVTPAALEALPWPTPERPIKQKLIPQLVSFC